MFSRVHCSALPDSFDSFSLDLIMGVTVPTSAGRAASRIKISRVSWKLFDRRKRATRMLAIEDSDAVSRDDIAKRDDIVISTKQELRS